MDLVNDSHLPWRNNTSNYINGNFLTYLYINHKMLLTLIKSFARFFASEIRKVASQMRKEYQNDIMGKVAITIYRHHKGSPTTYKLCQEAQEYFDGILDNLASQFNSPYDIKDSITESQTQLDEQQRADIDVRTKAGELIGRLLAVLWIYNNGKLRKMS